METTNHLNEGQINKPKDLSQVLDRESDRLFISLQNDNISTSDVQDLFSSFSIDNPLFSNNLLAFQDNNSSNFEALLQQNLETETSLDFFGIHGELDSLKGELESIGLDINSVLDGYKNHIEENLQGLPQDALDKVKLSIKTKVLQLGEIIEELKQDELDDYGNLDNFSENRWIINARIEKKLGFINHELLPSLEAYLKIKSGENFPTKFLDRFDTSNGADYSGMIPKNANYINCDYHIEETQELINAPIDENGNFDEGFFSTQRIFDMDNKTQFEGLNSLGIEQIDINLLNEADKKLEEKAMLYFMAMIGVQIGVETLGGLAGTIAGGGVDLYDTFSKDESLLLILQKIGLVEDSYRMDKTWIDNILAGFGLIPGMTQIIKGSKLAKFLEKIPPEKFEEAVETVRGGLNVSEKINPKFIDYTVEDIAKLSNPERLDFAKHLLGKELSEIQKEAIIKAHNIGNNREGAGIYNFTRQELKEKALILKESGFNVEERRLLLENGVCATISKEKLFQLEIIGDTLDEQVDFLFELAENTRKDYDELLIEIGDETNAVKILNSKIVPLKGKETVTSKILSEYEGKYPEKVRDILRGSIVYDDIADLQKGLDSLKASEKISVIHVNERLDNILTNDVLVNVRFPNGFVAEIQLHISETLKAKETGFILDKSIIDLDNIWSDVDYTILDKLKKGEYGGRKLDDSIILPTSKDVVKGHTIYEITRSLESAEDLTKDEITFLKNLKNLQVELNLYAREEYKLRTGKEFTN